MKIDRLVGIIMILLRQGHATAPELARHFEVSRRTISRDLEDICTAGIPLVTTQGRGGGISIAENYIVDKTYFTREEIQALLTGLKGIDSVSAAPHWAQIAAKLSGEPPGDQVILIDLASHYYNSLSEKIRQLREAILARQVVRFRYYYEKGDALRQAEPYRIVFRWSGWYLSAFCLDRQAFRLFKLNRLWELQVTEETFRPRPLPPEETNPDRYFQSGEPYHLKALFHPGEKYRLIEMYGPSCFTQENGRLLFEEDFVNYNHMLQWVLSFGDRVEVLSPAELVQDRLRQARHILGEASSEKPPEN